MSNIISELTPLEIKVFPLLVKESELDKIVKETGLKDIEVQRAAQWLSNKNLVKLEKQEEEFINLDINGVEIKEKGFPEKRLLKLIEKNNMKRSEILKELSSDELNVSIGLLKRQKALNIEKENELIFSITKEGILLIKEKNDLEVFLENIFPISVNKLNDKDKKAMNELLSRKNILKKDKKTYWFAHITDKGKEISKEIGKDSLKYEEKLSSSMLKDGSWKNKKFRSFDINSKVPRINKGRKHFVNEAIEYMKSLWLEMGFEEMDGTESQSAFWDLDALFVPQDHPAREMQDTFYLDVEKSKIEPDLFKKVKSVHEFGGETGSKGWKYEFSKDISQQTLLRTHTTVLSAQTISKLKKEDLPKKFFKIGKVFRNEAVDWKHLFQFQQVEGIVVDLDGNLAKLKGYLKEFFGKMGYTDVRIRPAYFPYTEPSAEVEVYHPGKKQWIEMGGCGIFRPEVTKTLMGFECPVLAWGLGMERIILAYYELTDLRDLYRNDLEQLRNMKSFLK
ncbi:phenylalanine--tRNA ligase subunit alpha [Candidatus Woesearchaeota archaeon]|nr:phenylalanine--tRNA ligase subunit alpha [Candidatus Woesearchaeota archaeon]MCF7900783.1 phenylalanine--tRNA ligase subunit alpha [Candidatus Woesearchaeota archaeon]MCF8013085.1 phenylalanine--tRNA ligase subunit alpha [Candidatus Woesearchaeota archaeon]